MKLKRCQCCKNCQRFVKTPGRRFALGHYVRTKAIRKKQSISNKRVAADPIIKARHLRAVQAPGARARKSKALRLKYKNDPVWAARRLKSVQLTLKKKSTRRAISDGLKLMYFISDQKQLKSIKIKEWVANHPLEVRESVKRMNAGHSNRPNGAERELWNLVQKAFPRVFSLNCSLKCRFIGQCIPDFICESKKVLLEMFGDFWHGQKWQQRTKKQEENIRKQYFQKLGYSTVIIWESELKHPELVIRKISNALNSVRYVCISDPLIIRCFGRKAA